MATAAEGEGEEQKLEEAARLRELAESKFRSTNNPKSALKYAKRAHRLAPDLDGISETVTSLNVLCAPDWYSVLGVDPFTNANAIRKQYRKLASLLNNSNNVAAASEEAFKLVREAFGILSDRSRRKDYDANRTFWTACSTCRLLHQFERRYLGHNLVCPSCNQSFRAVEAVNNDGSFQEEEDKTLGDFVLSKKEKKKIKKMGGEKGAGLKGNDEVGGGGRLRRRMCTVGEVLERSKPKRVRVGEETMTLAEFQSEVKRKAQQGKMKEKEEEGRIDKRSKQGGLGNKSVKLAAKEKHDEGSVKRKGLRLQKHRDSSGGESDAMAVVDSDFYDFDKDRVERSFKRGQVWAVYGDDDGMPRHYALIDETVSANPFQVRISWLDLQSNGDGKIVGREKLGLHMPCGRFKVARKDSISSVNIFSHVVDCDRAAREVYKVYPKKGSVWALYSEASLDVDGRRFADEGKRCYDIVVFLTSYSEMNDLSMAYLEKVDGYKTVFKRQEMGSHAIRFLGKDDTWLISHQIPARKFPCDEATELLKDCWELDPASLPSDLLTIGGWHR